MHVRIVPHEILPNQNIKKTHLKTKYDRDPLSLHGSNATGDTADWRRDQPEGGETLTLGSPL